MAGGGGGGGGGGGVMACGYISDIAEKGSERISMNRYVGLATRKIKLFDFFIVIFSIVLATSPWLFHALGLLLLYLRFQSQQFRMQYHYWSQGFPDRNLAHGQNQRRNLIISCISEPPGPSHATDVVTCFKLCWYIIGKNQGSICVLIQDSVFDVYTSITLLIYLLCK